MSFFPRDLPAPAALPRPSVSWEEPDCLLCGRRHWVLLVEGPDPLPESGGLWFAVVQCQECGLCFTSPRPDAASIGRFYPPTYRPHQTSRRRRPARRRRTSWRLPGKALRVLSGGRPGRLLDFGCGSGSFLERMHALGWLVTGIDAEDPVVSCARQRGPWRVLSGTLPHPELRPASFDVVTMWHSLEHVHNPLGVLHQAHRLLVPGGKLCVAVPNIESLPFRWFGNAWVGLDLPRHLTHFAPATLHRMLGRAGFRVESVGMVRHSHWLRNSAELSCRRAKAPHWHRWLRTKALSRLATWYAFLTDRADCLLATAEKAA